MVGGRELNINLTLVVNNLCVHIVNEVQEPGIALNQRVSIHKLHQQTVSIIACLA